MKKLKDTAFPCYCVSYFIAN